MSAQVESIMLDHALQYAALGYSVFPLHWIASRDAQGGAKCSCKDADCRSAAKHPLTKRGVHEATVDIQTIKDWWTRWPHANIGMSLERLVAIDTDPRNGGDVTLEVLQEEYGMLPDTALALTGGGGTHHIYQAPEGVRLPGKLGKGVDIKSGRGSYIVVEPSRHVDGPAYHWEASGSLLTGTTPAALPYWVANGVASDVPAGSMSRYAPTVGAVGHLSPQRTAEIASALCYIPADDRDTWVRMGMALHSTGAPNAFGLWTEWSRMSSKFDPVDQGRVWASFKGSANGVHVESIFAVAADNGWVNPASSEAQRFSEDIEARIAARNAESRIELIEPHAPGGEDAFPVAALNDLSDWITGRYSLTHPQITMQTTLALASLAASRVYVGQDGSPAHLCLGVIAESSVLTNYARDAVSRVLDAVGMRRMMRGTRANTPSAVYSTLFRSPASIHVVNDYGHLAAFAKRQPSGVLDQVFSVMADAYTSSALYVDSAAEAGLKPGATDDQLVVRNPALTSLLLSTNAQMGSLLQHNEITRGLMAYQLPVLADTAGAIEREPAPQALPQHLYEQFRTVRRLPLARGGCLSMQDIFGSQPGVRPNLIRVRDEIPNTEHMAAIRAVSDNINHRPIVLAAIGTARRICNVLAAWNDPDAPVITRDILDWATGYTIKHLQIWLAQYSTLGNDGTVDVGQQVVATVDERKTQGLARSQVHMYCRAFRNIRDREKRKQLIDSLIEDGDLVEFTPEGRRQKTLVSARFARRVQVGGDS